MTNEKIQPSDLNSSDYELTEQPGSTEPIESAEPIFEEKVEKKGLSPKQQLAIAMGVIAFTAAALGGVTVNALSQRQSTITEAPANPGNPTNTGETKQEEIPAEAMSFVSEYGSRYTDPVSTYYAEQAYIAAGNKGLLMPDVYINEYDASAQMDRLSPLGFEWYSLSPDAKIDLSTSMEIFNKYTAKEVGIYMNALAKNPTPEATTIIDNEFMNYCSDTNNANRFTEDDKYINTLMETAKSIVAKYGSAANYTLAQGSTIEGKPNSTYFDKDLVTIIQGQDENGVTNIFENKINLAIEVEVFSGKSSTKDEVIIKDAEIFVIRQLNSARISIGQIVR